ncbi:MAG: hypothetical protein LBD57_04380 [Endomicrobium sp.]|jgi:hypothetical protein|uniref:hypothetical protein n=1 Tax=Candidatus Endomicrobiellum cubanum TaxID=3242325 RepID=UPI00281BF92E|nr:hypothetical protein [Endomicrobium sp.]
MIITKEIESIVAFQKIVDLLGENTKYIKGKIEIGLYDNESVVLLINTKRKRGEKRQTKTGGFIDVNGFDVLNSIR